MWKSFVCKSCLVLVGNNLLEHLLWFYLLLFTEISLALTVLETRLYIWIIYSLIREFQLYTLYVHYVLELHNNWLDICTSIGVPTRAYARGEIRDVNLVVTPKCISRQHVTCKRCKHCWVARRVEGDISGRGVSQLDSVVFASNASKYIR